MNLADTVASLASGTYTVTRYSASAYGTDGRLDAPTTSTFSILASVQPLTGRDLQRLPEGLRTAELLAVFTETELKTQGATQDPDSVSIDGFSYEVQTVDRWGTLGNYYRAVVAKKGH